MVASNSAWPIRAKVLADISNCSREEVQMHDHGEGDLWLNRMTPSLQEKIIGSGERADDIGKIIEVIDDPAEQTNRRH